MDQDHVFCTEGEHASLQPKLQSRRTLLRRVSLAGAGVVLVPLLVACGGGDDDDDEEGEEQEEDV
jgi:hypothetical protein